MKSKFGKMKHAPPKFGMEYKHPFTKAKKAKIAGAKPKPIMWKK